MSDCAKYCGKKRSSGTVCEKYSGLYTEQKGIELISTREIIKVPKWYSIHQQHNSQDVLKNNINNKALFFLHRKH